MDLRKLFFACFLLALSICFIVGACENDTDDDDSESAGDDDSEGDDDTVDDDDSDDIREASDVTDSGCMKKAFDIYDDGTYMEEFVFEWDGAGTVEVFHRHVCYNCAFSIHPAYSVTDGTITIWERSQEGFVSASCLCLYEYSYELLNIPAGDYEVEVILQYRSEEEFPNGKEFTRLQETISLPEGEPSTEAFSEYHDEGCG